LTIFAEACSATEVVLFERTTFLVIATSSPVVPPSISSRQSPSTPGAEQDQLDIHQLNPTRYERTSELIKAFKHSCSRVREEFHSLEMELHDFTAVLDEMTRNTYVLIIVHDPTIGIYLQFSFDDNLNDSKLTETAALKLNIRMARRKFEELQGDSLIS
jgi:Ras-related GTP-binding protein A/B